ncbi:MAG: serine hydroxymethyltransferase [Candidatus Syntrophoarchaeum caldarius]|uniref:Serine hydroxymethyltransferase n=1 Tax=Candidatus Syntropharchaeum caldarium TaxID=1838285 RepID=A0A1F2PA11_9EURY|nr:MAG: serine hydroxymethyltransferase [Candidatus Syntrophoarchaeum caldarius]
MDEEVKKRIQTVMDAVINHTALYRESLPMIASENVTSGIVKKLLMTDLGHRYAEGSVGERFYQGCDYIDIIEREAIASTKKLFRAEHVNVQPISGVTANMAAFFALASPGDRIMTLNVPTGGHISHVEYSAAGIRGLVNYDHPFDEERMNIDPDRMVKKIREIRPKIVLFGASVFLFPHPVSEAREAADEVGAKIVYDGAHVLGLIAGGVFQDPLREGADVMTGSTHKTFPGPQGAIICCKKELGAKIDPAVFPGTVSNHHLHHLTALTIALLEMQTFGTEYAREVVKNAKAFAQALYESGFDVLCEPLGFTESHQVVVRVTDCGGGSFCAKRLEDSGVIANKNILPADKLDPENPSGLRFGLQELTRIGMKRSEMIEIAKIIKLALIDKKDPQMIREMVRELKKPFDTVCYAFDDSCPYPDVISPNWMDNFL